MSFSSRANHALDLLGIETTLGNLLLASLSGYKVPFPDDPLGHLVTTQLTTGPPWASAEPTMPTTTPDPLTIRVPASKTGIMSLIQTLVAHGATYWVGGHIKPEKLARLAAKFAKVYPICRDTRGRTYDKSVGRAVVSLIVSPGEMAYWWLLSTPGKGGLADPTGPDFKVVKNALAAGEHIIFEDYQLVYATKKEAKEVVDKKTGSKKVIFSNSSTWTWQMTKEAMSECRATIGEQCRNLAWGVRDPDKRPYGIRTYLAQQARRPLFSGVRSQVLELNRHAHKEWGGVLHVWRARNPHLVARDGEKAGTLVPLSEVLANLAKMKRLPIYGDKPATIQDVSTSPNSDISKR